jgi:hypothetical protein
MAASAARKIAAIGTILGLTTIGTAAAPKPANAWWRPYGWGASASMSRPSSWRHRPPTTQHRPTTLLPRITHRLPVPGSPRTGKETTGFPVIGREAVKQFISDSRM